MQKRWLRLRRLKLWAGCFLGVWGWGWGISACAEEWQPAETWVFMVGVLEWENPSYERYPQKDRRDAQLAALFQSRGVPKEQMRFYKDAEATRERVAKEFERFLDEAGGTLIVYYAGHGAEENGTAYFIPYDAGASLEQTALAVPAIFDVIEQRFRGRRALLLADCCNSGALAEEAQKRAGTYACLAASRFDSSSTGNWTFTESLLAGLGGDARVDADGDGQVSFAELAQFTEQEMAFAEGQLAAWAVIGTPAEWILAPAAPAPDPSYGRRVQLDDGKGEAAWVVETDGDRLKVRTYGYEAQERWVDAARVWPWSPKEFAVGTVVEVLWPQDGVWYDATVRESRLGVHRIHYEGYGEEWDEWVSADRIRARGAD